MAQFYKIVKTFILTILILLLILLAANAAIYAIYVHTVVNVILRPSIQSVMETISDGLAESDEGYLLSEDAAEILSGQNAWALLLDDESGNVLWQERSPSEIPTHYTATDIAKFSRGYLADYPVFTWEHPDGLLVVGYPKGSYTKQLTNYTPLALYRTLPAFWLFLLVWNLLILFLLYYLLQARANRSLEPVITGICDLAGGNPAAIREQGPFAELSQKVNAVSAQLQKRTIARANWISGISHDIRTPLSVIIGYAGIIEEQSEDADIRKKAAHIQAHGMRIQNFVNDLNLASKLDSHMQPLNLQALSVAPLLRKLAVDFLNRGYEEAYEIHCDIHDLPGNARIRGDASLLERALENLIFNSIIHNPDGCSITLSAKKVGRCLHMIVSDDGVGVTDEKLQALNHVPHYMLCDADTPDQRHGLGLLIVKQIAAAHGGTVSIGRSSLGGFSVDMEFPCIF